jgi:multiple sugar transport system permease protein/putative aldouronate transport system permease protein
MFYVTVDLMLLFALLVVAYPILYMFSASFSDPQAVIGGKVILFPVNFTLEGYAAIFRDSRVVMGYLNTIFYTVVGTTVNLTMTILCAYPLSRLHLAGRRGLMILFAFTMIFTGGMLPTYLVVRNLGLLDTRGALILPAALNIYNMIVMRTFFQNNIPNELYESAVLDGCGNIRCLLHIVLPLSKAIIAVMVLFYGVEQWNKYFDAFIYLTKRELLPLQVILREILVQNKMPAVLTYDPVLAAKKQGLAELLKYSLIIVSSLPIWCVYPFVQRYFVKGILVGSIKG